MAGVIADSAGSLLRSVKGAGLAVVPLSPLAGRGVASIEQ
jgi:hypothetical protein